MAFKRDEGRTCYLFDTHVENLFICEYMPDAPGDYVKVYLYALMEAERGEDPDLSDLARELRLSVDDVEKAFLYFEEAGAMVREGGDMVFLSLKEKLYGTKRPNDKPSMEEKSPTVLDDQPIKEMFDEIQRAVGRFLGATETQAIIGWIDDYGATSEVVARAYVYCAAKGKTNYKYVEKVVKDWVGRGFQTGEDVERHLGDADQRHYSYRRVMKALGFHRSATEEERRIMDTWLDELNCSMEDILSACSKTSGIPNPNINYVNAVIKGRIKEKEKGPARSTVMAHYEELRKEAEARSRRAKEEIYEKIPRIKEIEDRLVEYSMELTKVMIEGDAAKGERISGIKENVEALKKEKVALLTEHDIPVDYANLRYRCDLCKDTGVTESGERCRCYQEVAREATAAAKS